MFQDLSEHTLKYRMCLRGNGFLFHKNATLMGKKCGEKRGKCFVFLLQPSTWKHI